MFFFFCKWIHFPFVIISAGKKKKAVKYLVSMSVYLLISFKSTRAKTKCCLVTKTNQYNGDRLFLIYETDLIIKINKKATCFSSNIHKVGLDLKSDTI